MAGPLIVTISGSPSETSRTRGLAEDVQRTLAANGFDVAAIDVRDLPPDDLLHARCESAALRDALGLVARARGVVVLTPVYKAAYSGIMKAFLDLLPQFGLDGKVVLPLATGGTLAHVLAIDYALRPVLLSLGARHVVAGLFVLDKLLDRDARGGVEVSAEIRGRLDGVVNDFALSVRAQAA